jgi:hypothetical protein
MATVRDLALDVNYDLAVVGQDLAPLVADEASIISDLNATCLFMFGEWFADQSQGLPWFTRVLGSKKPNLALMQSQVATALAARRGVSQVLSVQISLTTGRLCNVTWEAQTDAGLLGSTVAVSP